MSTLHAVGPWLVGIGWGALVVVPLVVRSRRRALTDRVRALRPLDRGVPARRARLLALARRATGPVGRVVGGLARRRRMARERELLERDLPVAVDVLSVAVAAGCTPYLAVETAARWAPRTIARHCSEVLRASGLGVAFADALDDTARRAPVLLPVVRALVIADRTGAPVAPALDRLAGEQRAELRQRAEERARKVPVRLLFPLVFLVLPAFGLLTVAPALLAGFDRG
jgi:tight adherence protein C